MDCNYFIDILHNIQTILEDDISWYHENHNSIHYLNIDTIQYMELCIENIKNRIDASYCKIKNMYVNNKSIRNFDKRTLKNASDEQMKEIFINLKHDKTKYKFYRNDTEISNNEDFIRSVYLVLSQLNNGKCWDDIYNYKYDVIKKQRDKKSSASEFSKFVFNLNLNRELECISNNIENIEKTYLYRYEYYKHPLPPGVHIYDLQKIPIRCTSIQRAPFMKKYIIESTSKYQ